MVGGCCSKARISEQIWVGLFSWMKCLAPRRMLVRWWGNVASNRSRSLAFKPASASPHTNSAGLPDNADRLCSTWAR